MEGGVWYGERNAMFFLRLQFFIFYWVFFNTIGYYGIWEGEGGPQISIGFALDLRVWLKLTLNGINITAINVRVL